MYFPRVATGAQKAQYLRKDKNRALDLTVATIETPHHPISFINVFEERMQITQKFPFSMLMLFRKHFWQLLFSFSFFLPSVESFFVPLKSLWLVSLVRCAANYEIMR